MKNLYLLIALALNGFLILFTGCYGGNSPGASESGIKTYSLKGVIEFPSDGAIPAKESSKMLEAASSTVTVKILDLHGNLIATPEVTPGDTANTYNYKTTTTINVDSIVQAVRGSQTLKAALESSTYTPGSTKNVDVTSTTAVLLIEQNLGVSYGTLGTSSAAQTIVASAISNTTSVAVLETSITQAISAVNSSTTSVTTTTVAYANLLSIVSAATVNNIDAAQYIAGTTTATISTPVTTYSISASSSTPIKTTISSTAVITTATTSLSALAPVVATITPPIKPPTGSTGGTII